MLLSPITDEAPNNENDEEDALDLRERMMSSTW